MDIEGSHIALGCLKGESWFYVQLSSVSYKEHTIAVAKIRRVPLGHLKNPFRANFLGGFFDDLTQRIDHCLPVIALFAVLFFLLSLPSSVCRTKQTGFLANSVFLGAK